MGHYRSELIDDGVLPPDDNWITPEERARGYERIIPFDREPIPALDEQEAGDLRCGCALFAVTFIRRDVFPVLCECPLCGASWMRNQP